MQRALLMTDGGRNAAFHPRAKHRALYAASERDPSRDQERHRMLVTLLADEMARDRKPPDSQSLAELFAETMMVAELSDELNRLPDA
jgi:hypothetical protein